ncbi:unnamed protein product [Mytilus coruscus]|uniref:Uncharacterized protein n=1 Tax=Mytilus coruscus TaxID=42192 RepID=A0A6J8DRU8_MYTCO|nr:unnamed protein product [Mytilus coruscus]
MELTVSEEYLTKFCKVNSLSVGIDDSLWIGSGKVHKGFFTLLFASSKALQKVRLKGNKMKVIEGFNIEVKETALSPFNDLLIVSYTSRLKQVMRGSGKISDSKYCVEPLVPLCVHFTKDNKVLIGAVEDLFIDLYNMHVPDLSILSGRRAIFIMDIDGNHLDVVESDNVNKPLFIYPRHITTCSETIFVVDLYCKAVGGRVVILDSDKSVKAIYTGNPEVRYRFPFTPYHVASTASESVIVSDFLGHALHLLNKCGQLVTYFDTLMIGIQYPTTLAITTTEQYHILYMGNGDFFDDSKTKAQIYAFQLSLESQK